MRFDASLDANRQLTLVIFCQQAVKAAKQALATLEQGLIKSTSLNHTINEYREDLKEIGEYLLSCIGTKTHDFKDDEVKVCAF